MNCIEKDKIKKFCKENEEYIREIYNKHIDYMKYYGIEYQQFVIFCYLYK